MPTQVQQVQIRTTSFAGRDGRTYPIFLFHEGGRGWTAFHSYIPATLDPVTLRGEVVEAEDENLARYLAHHSLVRVKLDAASLKIKVRSFARRPYVSRKTGISNPHVLVDRYGYDLRAIKNIYACHICGGGNGVTVKSVDVVR